MSSRQRPRQPDRLATEAALQRAALLLLERNGILAGLNLRQVAEEAGVNRGLVYHYFGSRRDLLRAALRSNVTERLSDFAPGRGLAAPSRYERFFRTMLSHREAAVLATLLVLDGDRGVRMIPNPDGTRGRIRRDVEEGNLPADVDADAVHAAFASMIYGYMVLRERLADELDVEVGQLDENVAETVGLLMRSLAPDTSATP
jgi:AcrR family transcriptional regulator